MRACCIDTKGYVCVLQSGSCSLAVSSTAYAGVDAPSLQLDAGPAIVHAAIRHAQQFATNVPPVSSGVYCVTCTLDLAFCMRTTEQCHATQYVFERQPFFLHALNLGQRLTWSVHMQQAASSASKGAPRAEGFELDLLDSRGAWVASSTLLLGLASGQLVALNLQAEGGTVRRIKACRYICCSSNGTQPCKSCLGLRPAE